MLGIIYYSFVFLKLVEYNNFEDESCLKYNIVIIKF